MCLFVCVFPFVRLSEHAVFVAEFMFTFVFVFVFVFVLVFVFVCVCV